MLGGSNQQKRSGNTCRRLITGSWVDREDKAALLTVELTGWPVRLTPLAALRSSGWSAKPQMQPHNTAFQAPAAPAAQAIREVPGRYPGGGSSRGSLPPLQCLLPTPLYWVLGQVHTYLVCRSTGYWWAVFAYDSSLSDEHAIFCSVCAALPAVCCVIVCAVYILAIGFHYPGERGCTFRVTW